MWSWFAFRFELLLNNQLRNGSLLNDICHMKSTNFDIIFEEQRSLRSIKFQSIRYLLVHLVALIVMFWCVSVLKQISIFQMAMSMTFHHQIVDSMAICSWSMEFTQRDVTIWRLAVIETRLTWLLIGKLRRIERKE